MEKHRSLFIRKGSAYRFIELETDKSLFPWERSRLFFEFKATLNFLLEYKDWYNTQAYV